MTDNWKWDKTFLYGLGVIAVTFIALACIVLAIFYLHPNTCPEENKADFSIISNENIDKFCVENGYMQGWAGCGISVGFTCYKENAEGYSKTACFEYVRLLEVK